MGTFFLGFILGIGLAALLLFTVGKKKLKSIFADAMIKNTKIIYNSIGKQLTEKQLNQLKQKMGIKI